MKLELKIIDDGRAENISFDLGSVQCSTEPRAMCWPLLRRQLLLLQHHGPPCDKTMPEAEANRMPRMMNRYWIRQLKRAEEKPRV